MQTLILDSKVPPIYSSNLLTTYVYHCSLVHHEEQPAKEQNFRTALDLTSTLEYQENLSISTRNHQTYQTSVHSNQLFSNLKAKAKDYILRNI